jgi:hypothetical protein
LIIERDIDKQIKTTRKVNKLKQNRPKTVDAVIKSDELNFNNVISNNIKIVWNTLEQAKIFELNKR